MLKVGFPSFVAKAALKMESICDRKLACLHSVESFLVVTIVGRREYSLQIM